MHIHVVSAMRWASVAFALLASATAVQAQQGSVLVQVTEQGSAQPVEAAQVGVADVVVVGRIGDHRVHTGVAVGQGHRVGLPEPFEHVWEERRRNADTGVCDRQNHLLIRPHQLHADTPSGLRELDGVPSEVPDDLFEPARFGVQPLLVGTFVVTLVACAVAQWFIHTPA